MTRGERNGGGGEGHLTDIFNIRVAEREGRECGEAVKYWIDTLHERASKMLLHGVVVLLHKII